MSPKTGKSTSTAVKYYLIAYNILSAAGWSYILLLTLVQLSNIDGRNSTAPAPQTASSALARLLAAIPYLKSSTHLPALAAESRIPPSLRPLYTRAAATYARVGAQTALVQSFAALEVAHALLGWVRSPVQTTAMQVSSRLYVVWGIAERFAAARASPVYAAMVLAWSATEVVRYAFYAGGLLGHEPHALRYLRYTTFYVLYLVGAPSEALLIYATLPRSSPVPSVTSWMQGMWRPGDYFRAAMFAVWWPCLYVMYTHMIRQRRKVLGSGAAKATSKAKAQ